MITKSNAIFPLLDDPLLDNAEILIRPLHCNTPLHALHHLRLYLRSTQFTARAARLLPSEHQAGSTPFLTEGPLLIGEAHAGYVRRCGARYKSGNDPIKSAPEQSPPGVLVL